MFENAILRYFFANIIPELNGNIVYTKQGITVVNVQNNQNEIPKSKFLLGGQEYEKEIFERIARRNNDGIFINRMRRINKF
jgi:hypothetical protein